MSSITRSLPSPRPVRKFHSVATYQLPRVLCFASPTACFARRAGRTTSPSKYRLQHHSESLYTLVADTPNTAPNYVHILPIVHAPNQPTSTDLQVCLQKLNPQPNALVLELCTARTHLLEQHPSINTTTGTLSPQKHRPFSFQTLLEAILQRQTATLQKALHVNNPSQTSEQLRQAVQTWTEELKKPQRSIILGDRRIDKTLRQWANTASLFEKLILLLDATAAPFVMYFQPSWQQLLRRDEQVDKWRSRLAARAPAAFQSLCINRELHMTWAVRDSAPVLNVDSVALVCGVLHARAIVELLMDGQVIDIESLSSTDC